MNTFSTITTLFGFLVITASCNETPISPAQKEYPTGPRNYEWEIFDLNEMAPENQYTNIFGVTPDEVWIVGTAGDYDKTILRFNGDSLSLFGQFLVDPTAIFGFDQNEIWFAGRAFDYWKYDGSLIYKFSTNRPSGYANSLMVDMWGDSKNNIYAVGSGTIDSGTIKGFIMHYDGSSWDYVINPVSYLHLIKIRKESTDTRYYILGVNEKQGEPESFRFYEFDGSTLKPFFLPDDSYTNNKNLTLLDGDIFFYDNKEIYRLEFGKAEHYLSLNNTKVAGTQIWGRHPKDFFIKTWDGIGHYNGSDLATLFTIKDEFLLFNGLILESDVYFVGLLRDTFKYILVHGKIK